MPIILNGKELADTICDNLKWYVKGAFRHDPPTLIILTTDPDKANQTYLRNKIRRCKEIGIDHILIEQSNITKPVLEFIKSSKCPVIVQAPFKNTGEFKINWYVKPRYDVDGFIHEANVADVYTDCGIGMNKPCTPLGIMCLLEANHIPIQGKHVCIVGRSVEVGRPLAALMMRANASVSICHSYTNVKHLHDLLDEADIIVSAVGIPNYIGTVPLDYEQYKNKILIDVGINHIPQASDPSKSILVGDISQEVKDASYAYTPVPGGVGPMTVAMLMYNTVKAHANEELFLGDFCKPGCYEKAYREGKEFEWLMK